METKTFKSGNSEAVRLPTGVSYGVGTLLEVTRSGDVVTLRPARAAGGLREAVEMLRRLPKPDTVERFERVPLRDTLDDL
jgi:antitoxin VapB